MEAANDNYNQNQIVNENGKVSTVAGPKAVNIFATRTVMLAIKLYLETGIQPNRAYTPTKMREFASKVTGEKYPRSRNGLVAAFYGLQEYLSKPETFDGVDVINR